MQKILCIEIYVYLHFSQLDSVLESLSTSEDSELDEVRPRLFSTLVHLLSHLDAEELEEVWSSSSSENTHR